MLIGMNSKIVTCFPGTMLAYFKVYRIVLRHYNQIRGSGIFQNFGQPAIDWTKCNKPVASMLYCVVLLFSICVLPYFVSTMLRKQVNLQRLARDEERIDLCCHYSGANVFVIVSQSFEWEEEWEISVMVLNNYLGG